MKEEQQLRDTIFPARWERAFFSWYHRIFSIHELESSKILKWVFGATLFSFFLTFNSWIGSHSLTLESYIQNRHTCWPFWQQCGEWYVLQALPYGYSQTILYMGLFALMGLVVYLMHRREWVLAHLLVVVLFLFKGLAGFLLTYELTGNYDYYHMAFAAILLFFPYKYFFLKLVLVLFYTLSATVKIHEGWILGTYFSSLQSGLPIFPDATIPVWTNFVMLMQIVGAWFLLSSNKVLQRSALVFFALFHLYSGVLVEYRYPATVLPTLLILFGPWFAHTQPPLNRRALVGWIFVVFLIALQLSSIVIPKDEKVTLEGNRYGMYMFEANHQCISSATLTKKDGTVEEVVQARSLARHRCDPYDYWFSLSQICKRGGGEIEQLAWTFDHSVNGGQFYRIVDTQNVCELEYKAFGHNEWIVTPEDGAPAIGQPVKNVYY